VGEVIGMADTEEIVLQHSSGRIAGQVNFLRENLKVILSVAVGSDRLIA
jgi:hypothetical protein